MLSPKILSNTLLSTTVALSIVILPQRGYQPIGSGAAYAGEPVMVTDGGVVATDDSTPDTGMGDDIPEEILRTEIITEARSPLTGDRLSAAEYAQLLEELEAPAGGNLVNEDIRYLVYLLQIRRAIQPILPFID